MVSRGDLYSFTQQKIKPPNADLESFNDLKLFFVEHILGLNQSGYIYEFMIHEYMFFGQNSVEEYIYLKI